MFSAHRRSFLTVRRWNQYAQFSGNPEMIARHGDRVRIQYTRLHKPELAGPAASASAPKVLEFTIGGEHVLPGLSRCVAGMSQGEQKCVSLPAAEAFGDVQKRLIRELPRDCFRTKLPLAVGMVLNAKIRGLERPRKVRIVQLNAGTVIVDGNHPSAGRAVNLAVLVLSIDSSSEANQSKPQIDSGGES